MEAIGLVFLYNRRLGTPEEISKKFSEYFSEVSENLVMEHLISLNEFKTILDTKKVYWAGIKENFSEIQNNHDMIGKIAWKVFSDFSGIEPSEEVKSLVYNQEVAPWKFSLFACVIYK